MKFLHTLAVLLTGISLTAAHSHNSNSRRRHHQRAAAAASGNATSSITANHEDTGVVAASWYAGWHAEGFPLANVSWQKYNHMTYAFAVTTPDVNTLSLGASDASLLPQFVEQAHDNNVTALLSVGGWSGSVYYSSNVATAENRTAFVKAVTQLATNYSVDGLDFDWEYPNAAGSGNNIMSPNDTANFLAFLQELRNDSVGSRLMLTAPASITPWNDASQQPSTDLSAFANVLDYIAIMNYDIWGSWSTSAGPNAPLDDACALPTYQKGSAMGAVNKWHAAGIPLEKLVLGVPSYGHSFTVEPADAFVDGQGNLTAYPKFNSTIFPHGDKWDGSDGSNPTGAVNFWGMFDNGYLTLDVNGTITVANNIASIFDNCSQTPFLYDSSSHVFVSYDDPMSFAAKGAMIKSMGLRGFAVWETAGDYNNKLVDSIRAAVGL
ncbi:chitinase [Amylostereum chailletii]|nr:chitinase [Amylostereum chailletii]